MGSKPSKRPSAEEQGEERPRGEKQPTVVKGHWEGQGAGMKSLMLTDGAHQGWSTWGLAQSTWGPCGFYSKYNGSHERVLSSGAI